ncbi:glycosyltransferase [Sphaerisporangium dianthi]|uniref:Glycosyltransferase n=1 Tax=Sphaerisporangium dianthi TaxID=1436120 RepID=A0ABV9CJK1_9ACTN
MLPLAAALAAAGHEVLFAVPPEVKDIPEAAGLATVALGGHLDPLPAFRTVAASSPSGRSPAPAARGGTPRVLSLFVRLAEDMAGDLVAVAREYRPDLVLHDPTALAGPVAAAAVGARAVRHLYGLDLLARASPMVSRALEPLYRRFGLPATGPMTGSATGPMTGSATGPMTGSATGPMTGSATGPMTGSVTGHVTGFGIVAVDPWPGPARPGHLPIRHTAYGAGLTPQHAGRGAPSRAQAAAGRRRVCVSWGHTMARLDGGLHLAGQVARTVAADPSVEVVLATAPEHRRLLGALPPGVRVIEDGPLGGVIAGCDALISQGGAGVSLTALALGVPQLMIGGLPDHLAHARAVAELGAGRALTAGEAGDDTLRRELRLLLHTPAYRETAARLGQEMRARPSPDEVAAHLAGHRTPHERA